MAYLAHIPACEKDMVVPADRLIPVASFGKKVVMHLETFTVESSGGGTIATYRDGRPRKWQQHSDDPDPVPLAPRWLNLKQRQLLGALTKGKHE